SPGITASPYGLVDGHELGAIRKSTFHLDLVDHLADTFHHRVARENRRPDARDLRDGLAVADELEDFGGDERNGLRVIELQGAGAPSSRQLAGAEDEELVDLAWSQVYDDSLTCRRRRAAYASARPPKWPQNPAKPCGLL